MQFQRTEWYIFIFAAITVSYIYYKAFGANLGAISNATNSLLGKIMGQTPQGTFQAPF